MPKPSASREYRLKYRKKNRERIRAWKRKDYHKHREKNLARRREYYLANRNELLTKGRIHYSTMTIDKRGLPYECKMCQKTFYTYPSVASKRLFCSQKCRAEYQISRPCIQCGKPKNPTDFYAINVPAGKRIMSKCKECQEKNRLKRYWRDPVRARAKNKKWRERFKKLHPEKVAQYKLKAAQRRKHILLTETPDQRIARLKKGRQRSQKYLANQTYEQRFAKREHFRKYSRTNAAKIKQKNKKRTWFLGRLISMARDDGTYDLLMKEYENGERSLRPSDA